MSLEGTNFIHNTQDHSGHERPPKIDLPVIPFDEETHVSHAVESNKGELEVIPPEKTRPLTPDQIAALNEGDDWSKLTSGEIMQRVQKIRGTTPDTFEQVPQPYAKLTQDGLLVISTGYLRATPGEARKKYLKEESDRLGFKINEQEILAYIDKKYPKDNSTNTEGTAHSA